MNYRSLVDHVPDAVLRLDRHFVVLYANAAAARESGVPVETFIGRRLDDPVLAMPARLKQRWWDAFGAVLRSGAAQQFEFEVDGPHGHRWYDVRLAPEFDGDGEVETVVTVGRDVSLQRRAEATLQASEARLRLVVEQASDTMLSVDREGRFRFISPAIERVFGHGPQALLDTSARDIVHPDDWPAAEATLQAAFAAPGQNQSVRVRIADAAGHWRHCEAVGRTVDDASATGGLIVNLRDISAWHHAEAQRRTAEARFRALIEHAQDIVGVVTLDGTVIYESPSVERILGYPPAALIDRNVAELIHPDDWASVAHMLSQAAQQPGAVQQLRYRCRHGDGRWRTLQATTWNMSADPAVGGIVINARDVTESADAEAQLRWSEQRFRTLSNASPVGIFELTPDGRLTYANPRMLEMWELTAAQMNGTAWHQRVHPDDRILLSQKLQRALQTGNEYEASYRLLMPDGSLRHMHGHAAPLHDAHGQVVGCVGTVINNTQQQQMQQALAESERSLRLALGAGRMAAWSAPFARHNPDDPAAVPLVDPDSGRLSAVQLSSTNQRGNAPVTNGRPGDMTVTVHPDDRTLVQQAVDRCIASNQDLAAEYRVLTPDGRVEWRQAMGRLVRGADGTPEQLVGISQDVTDRKRLENELTWRAEHDALTGLANRVCFRERVGEVVGTSPPAAAVLFIDLDGFKTVNDSLGHQAGDRLLELVAARLSHATQGCDLVARLGGDEFAVLLVGPDAERQALQMAGAVVSALSTPFSLDGVAVRLGASVGVAPEQPGAAPDDLLRNADIALYQAKNAGKGRYQLFVPAMYTAAADRLTLDSDLHRAFEAGEFLLHYQPILDLASGRIIGAEALSRWLHPTRGMVPPVEFIAALEDNGGIARLGRRVLAQACREAARWAQETGQPLAVTVNVSARQLQDATFAAEVEKCLRTSGLPPIRLVLEITESVFMHDLETMLARLHELKALGVQLAVDDFGTGFSSLSYLQRLPIDVLKIDRSFVQPMADGPSGSALARTIIGLADLLGLRTVAEGVETPAQRAELMALGCRFAQGYLFARPMPAEAFIEHLRLEADAAAPAAPQLRSA